MEKHSVVPTMKKPTLQEVLARFETWRKGKRPGSRIPKCLRAAATDLCDVHSICEVSRALGLNYTELKRRYADATHEEQMQQHPTSACFVESPTLAISSTCEDDLPRSEPTSRSGGDDPWFLEPEVMIQITPQMRILVAVETQDFRKGTDGLSRICREVLREDPCSGSVFVFRNKAATSLKALIYDGQRFWLCQKRLSEGRFRWWPNTYQGAGADRSLLAHELQVLLWNGDASSQKMAPRWRKLKHFTEH